MPDHRLIPPRVIADIEEGVAEALNQPDLFEAVQSLLPRDTLPADLDEVDLVIMWVTHTRGPGWRPLWMESDTFRPFLDGCIIAATQAMDLAAGRNPADRKLSDLQRHDLQRWKDQRAHEDP